MIIISYYKTEIGIDGCISIKSKQQCICPDCGGNLVVRDTKRRKVKNGDGTICTYKLKRMKCKNCRKLHTQIPSCIIPYKHYAADVILSEFETLKSNCPADNATIRRWRLLGSQTQKNI